MCTLLVSGVFTRFNYFRTLPSFLTRNVIQLGIGLFKAWVFLKERDFFL